jgi:hypothetical protein
MQRSELAQEPPEPVVVRIPGFVHGRSGGRLVAGTKAP